MNNSDPPSLACILQYANSVKGVVYGNTLNSHSISVLEVALPTSLRVPVQNAVTSACIKAVIDTFYPHVTACGAYSVQVICRDTNRKGQHLIVRFQESNLAARGGEIEEANRLEFFPYAPANKRLKATTEINGVYVKAFVREQVKLTKGK